MIISSTLEYVYVGIPRTGSKSMSRWLTEHYEGQWYASPHQYTVPDFAREYLVFTTVRNPYDRATSGYFSIPWDDERPCAELRRQRPLPQRSEVPIAEQLRDARARKEGLPEEYWSMNQSRYVERSGIALALYFERLPDCLSALPFVAGKPVPPFPHALERGIRPPGGFFDFFSEDAERVAYEYAEDDFREFDYQRFQIGLPPEAPDARWLTGRRGPQVK